MIISSVEVIHQHEDGPDVYRVGNKLHPEGTVVHRIEESTEGMGLFTDRVYQLFDEADNEIIRIENCPVVVRYKPE